MTPQRYALLAGLALMGVAVVLGLLIPVSVTGDVGSQSCGAPWTGGQLIVANHLLYGSKATDYSALCSDARNIRGLTAAFIFALGLTVTCVASVRTAPKAVVTTSEPVVPSG